MEDELGTSVLLADRSVLAKFLIVSLRIIYYGRDVDGVFVSRLCRCVVCRLCWSRFDSHWRCWLLLRIGLVAVGTCCEQEGAHSYEE